MPLNSIPCPCTHPYICVKYSCIYCISLGLARWMLFTGRTHVIFNNIKHINKVSYRNMSAANCGYLPEVYYIPIDLQCTYKVWWERFTRLWRVSRSPIIPETVCDLYCDPEGDTDYSPPMTTLWRHGLVPTHVWSDQTYPLSVNWTRTVDVIMFCRRSAVATAMIIDSIVTKRSHLINIRVMSPLIKMVHWYTRTSYSYQLEVVCEWGFNICTYIIVIVIVADGYSQLYKDGLGCHDNIDQAHYLYVVNRRVGNCCLNCWLITKVVIKPQDFVLHFTLLLVMADI